MARKVKSLARGVSHIENKFWVFSPVSVPGPTGQKLSNWAVAPQIRLAALRRASQSRPVGALPGWRGLIETIPSAAVIMQRTDRFEAFPEADPDVVGRYIRDLKARADLAIYAAPHLMQEERTQVRRQP